MSNQLFFVILIIQFVVQLVLYYQVRFLVFYVGLFTSKVSNKDLKITSKSMFITALALNIIISLFVKLFTASGAVTGITNLFASTILGLIMYYDIVRVINKIKKEIKYAKQNQISSENR